MGRRVSSAHCKEKRRVPASEVIAHRTANAESAMYVAPLPSCAYVAQSLLLGPGQLGLFAAKDLVAGCVVTSMENPYVITRAQVQRLMCQYGLPLDAFLHVVHTSPAYRLDPRMLTGTPDWYRMNHSWRPNTALRSATGIPFWVALRNIRCDEE